MGALADHASETGSVQYAQFQRNYKSSKNSAKKRPYDPRRTGTRGKKSDRETAVSEQTACGYQPRRIFKLHSSIYVEAENDHGRKEKRKDSLSIQKITESRMNPRHQLRTHPA